MNRDPLYLKHEFKPSSNPRLKNSCQQCGRVREHQLHIPPATWGEKKAAA